MRWGQKFLREPVLVLLSKCYLVGLHHGYHCTRCGGPSLCPTRQADVRATQTFLSVLERLQKPPGDHGAPGTADASCLVRSPTSNPGRSQGGRGAGSSHDPGSCARRSGRSVCWCWSTCTAGPGAGRSSSGCRVECAEENRE